MTQHEKILNCLRDTNNQDKEGWVALPKILALGVAQYNARLHELRRRGYDIRNKAKWVGEQRHSWFRLIEPVHTQYQDKFLFVSKI